MTEYHLPGVAALPRAGIAHTDRYLAADAEEVSADQDVRTIGIEDLRIAGSGNDGVEFLTASAEQPVDPGFMLILPPTLNRTAVDREIGERHYLHPAQVVEPGPGDIAQIDEYAVVRREFHIVGKRHLRVSAGHLSQI